MYNKSKIRRTNFGLMWVGHYGMQV